MQTTGGGRDRRKCAHVRDRTETAPTPSTTHESLARNADHVDAQEMRVGIMRDMTFGPVMTISPGGIYAEIYWRRQMEEELEQEKINSL